MYLGLNQQTCLRAKRSPLTSSAWLRYSDLWSLLTSALPISHGLNPLPQLIGKSILLQDSVYRMPI